jgi:hypothetical protein
MLFQAHDIVKTERQTRDVADVGGAKVGPRKAPGSVGHLNFKYFVFLCLCGAWSFFGMHFSLSDVRETAVAIRFRTPKVEDRHLEHNDALGYKRDNQRDSGGGGHDDIHKQEGGIVGGDYEDLDKRGDSSLHGEMIVHAFEQQEGKSNAEKLAREYAAPDNDHPIVVFNDLRYRRVCSSVGVASVLCMTVRFPFEIPLQDTEVRFTKPFTKDYYNLDRENGAVIIDEGELDACRIHGANKTVDESVKSCLDATSTDENMVVAAVFTRRQKDGATTLFGTGAAEQIDLALEFFEGHFVLVLGASPAPPVTKCLQKIFGACEDTGMTSRGSFYCGNRRRLDSVYEALDESKDIYLGSSVGFFAPFDISGWDPNTDAVSLLNITRKPGWNTLRPLTLIVDYPIAHAQKQNLILNDWDKVEQIAVLSPAFTMSLMSETGKAALAIQGFDLKYIIAFDGQPQSFPTETGSWTSFLGQYTSSQAFLNAGGYPGWRKELGSNCQGPLPPNSVLTGINQISRQSFLDHGLDKRWHGNTWEFANLFWWQFAGCK